MKKLFIIVMLCFSVVVNMTFISNGVCELGSYTATSNVENKYSDLYFKDGVFFRKSANYISRFTNYVYIDGVVHILNGEISFYEMNSNFFTVEWEERTYINYNAILLQVGFVAIDVVFIVAIVLAFKKKN